MKLKELLENKLDELNYEIGFSIATVGSSETARKKVSRELGFIIDNFVYIGVTDVDRAEKICHYFEIRMHTFKPKSDTLRLKFREELLKIHKELVNWEEQK